MSVYNNLYWSMPIFLCLIVLLPNTPNKRLNGSTKHSILHETLNTSQTKGLDPFSCFTF